MADVRNQLIEECQSMVDWYTKKLNEETEKLKALKSIPEKSEQD